MVDSVSAPHAKISIGDLLQKTAVLIYKELENVRFSLKSADPEMRTISLRSFVQRTMKKLTQVYAIVEWCRHPETVLFFKTIENLTQQIRELETNMNLSTDRFFYMHAGLHGMRTLRDNVELAQDIVATGTYRYLPEAIFTCGDVNQPGKKRAEDIDKDAMIEDLNMYIRIRLFQYDALPAAVIDYSKIVGGYLILRRNDLYEVIVSLDHLSPRSQWVILHARVLVKNHELEYYDGTYDNNALGMDLLGILRKHALAAREAFQLEEQKKVDADKEAKSALSETDEAAMKHEERFNTIMDKYRLPFLKEVLDQAQGKKSSSSVSEDKEMDVVDMKEEKYEGSLDNTSVSGTTDGIDSKKKKSTFSLQQIESVCAQVALGAVHRSFYVQALDMSSHLWKGLLEASWVEEYESMDFRTRFWRSRYSDCFQYELLLQQKRAIVIKLEDRGQRRRSHDTAHSPVGAPLLATVSTLVPAKLVEEDSRQGVAVSSIPKCEQVPEFRVDKYYRDGVSFGRLFNSVLYSLTMCKLNLLYGRILAHPSFQKALTDHLVKIELSSYYLKIDVTDGVSISFSVNAQNGDFSFHIDTHANDYGLKNMCPSIENGLYIFLVEVNNLEFQDQMRSVLRDYGIQFVRDDLNERLQSNPSDININKKVLMKQKDAASQEQEIVYAAFDLKYMHPFTTIDMLLANLLLASWEVKAYEQREMHATSNASPELSFSKSFQPVLSNNVIDIPKVLNENYRTNLLSGSLLVANGITNPHMELLLGRYTALNTLFATGMDPICLSSAPAAKLPLKTLLKDYDNLTALIRNKSNLNTVDQQDNNNSDNKNKNINGATSSLLQATKRSDYDGTHAFYFDRGVSDVGLFLILDYQVATLSLSAHLWLCELSVAEKRVNTPAESTSSSATTTTKKKKGKKDKPLTVGQMRALEEKKMVEKREQEERESKERGDDDGMDREVVDDRPGVSGDEEAAPRATVSVIRTHRMPMEVALFNQVSTLVFDVSSLESILAQANEIKQQWFQEPLRLRDFVTPQAADKKNRDSCHQSVKISVCENEETVQMECFLATDSSSTSTKGKKEKDDQEVSIGNVYFSFFHNHAAADNNDSNNKLTTAAVSLHFRQFDVHSLESTNHAAIMTTYFRHMLSTLVEAPMSDTSAKSKDLLRLLEGQVSWKSNATAKEMRALLVKVMALSHTLMQFSHLAEAQSILDLSQATKSSNVVDIDLAVRDPQTNQFQLQVNTYNKPIEVQYLKCVEVDEEDGSLLFLPVANSLYDNGSAVYMADNRYGRLVRVKVSESAVLYVTDAMNADSSDFEEIVIAEDSDLTSIDCFRALVGRIVGQAL